jgi:hypothetical protein
VGGLICFGGSEANADDFASQSDLLMPANAIAWQGETLIATPV